MVSYELLICTPHCRKPLWILAEYTMGVTVGALTECIIRLNGSTTVGLTIMLGDNSFTVVNVLAKTELQK